MNPESKMASLKDKILKEAEQIVKVEKPKKSSGGGRPAKLKGKKYEKKGK